MPHLQCGTKSNDELCFFGSSCSKFINCSPNMRTCDLMIVFIRIWNRRFSDNSLKYSQTLV